MLVALIGNQNSGKSTLFNVLTGSNQHIGNYPGVTVDIKNGYVINHQEIEVVDLPGVYSLFPYSNDEVVTRKFIEDNKIDLILNVVDITNLERHLFLTLELMSLRVPILVVGNMIDEMESKGIIVNENKLSFLLKNEMSFISASKGIGIKELIDKLLNNNFCVNGYFSNYNMSIEEKYNFIDSIYDSCVSKKYVRKIDFDKLFLNKYLAYPIFMIVVGLVFYLTFSSFGLFLSDCLDVFLSSVIVNFSSFLLSIGVNQILVSLVCDGVLTGVFSVLSFIPIIVLLFFFLSLLEDSGYMARIAFIMDKPLRNFNLSGKSFVPLIMGFGCSVTSVMSSRNLSDKKERDLLIFLIPFMVCSAKLPVFVTLSLLFFSNSKFIILLLYFIGVLIALIVASISKYFIKIDSSFMLELPSYRIPTLKSVFFLVIDKIKDFVKKAFSVIFVSSILVWFLQSFNFELVYVSDNDLSILAMLSWLITPIFSLIGVSDWRITASLLVGISAKESIISTLNVLLSSSLSDVMNSLQAFSILVFVLLYMPCLATISVMKKELGSFKKLVMYIIFYNVNAYICSALIYQIGCLFL